jgi:hypothetical protein
MSSVEQAYETQLKNIQTKTGKSLEQLTQVIQNSGLAKHSEIRSMLIDKFGLGYGDANTLAHFARNSEGERAAKAKGLSAEDVLDEIYTGPKETLRPIHEEVLRRIHTFGDFEIAPKKGYISLRRKKQFAMVGPATKSQVEIGINVKNLPPSTRLAEQPPGSMCNYKLRLSSIEEVDDEIMSWLRQAYDQSG